MKEEKRWFQTYSGQKFYPCSPTPDTIKICDIAKALSNTCRFNGHITTFYSVAQHSVLVSKIVPEEYAFEGLMHDAAEAYIGDMVRPAKYSMPDYQRIEKIIEEVIASKYGLKYPWPKEVKEADDILLATERRDLVPSKALWSISAEPIKEKLIPLSNFDSEQEFLARFLELWNKR